MFYSSYISLDLNETLPTVQIKYEFSDDIGIVALQLDGDVP